MTLAALLVRTVTIHHAGTRVDAYGDTIVDWSTSTDVTAPGWLAYTSGIEILDGRAATSTTMSLSLPAGTTIDAADRVTIDGTTYDITAEPMSAWTPRGEHHIEINLAVVNG